MKLVVGDARNAKKYAKLIGELEEIVYPPEVQYGWEDFYTDLQENGADHTIIVLDGTPAKAIAYLVAFADSDTNQVYISDIARHPQLSSDVRQRAMLLLLIKAVELFRDKEIHAELRKPSRRLLSTFCDIHEEEELFDYYNDGESALRVRATIRPDVVETALMQYVQERAANSRR